MVQTPLIRFRIDAGSGVPVYRQLVDQVRQAVRLGLLGPGDQLPTVREAVRQIAVNPNTVHRAYQELERQGVVVGRQGQGTYVAATAATTGAPDRRRVLAEELDRWVRAARLAGMDDQEMRAALATAVHDLEAR
jgi:GntR family transcriptional regulator